MWNISKESNQWYIIYFISSLEVSYFNILVKYCLILIISTLKYGHGISRLSWVGWLILLPPIVGWDIVRYKSGTLPSYTELRNCSYSIMLNYTYSPSTPEVHLPRPGPTISYSVLSPDSALTWRRVHKWGGMPPFPIWTFMSTFLP